MAASDHIPGGHLMSAKDMSEGKESKIIRMCGIEPESIVDGPGFRFVIFVQGCPHHCHGCRAVRHRGR